MMKQLALMMDRMLYIETKNIATSNTGGPLGLSAEDIRGEIRSKVTEMQEQENWRNILVIYNVEEIEGVGEQVRNDVNKQRCEYIFDNADKVTNTQVIETVRLGKEKTTSVNGENVGAVKPRPLLVKMRFQKQMGHNW
ncbi:hypothetical protein SK128_020122 [Halocaridina rubra]|uniref:Uncharacterized protein n=1 Tax=Halocaridina rubra TaxID=373956 RepID=A0AAN8XPY4_HALRR